MSGRWRDRLTGVHDEFTEKGPALTSEQREHLTRVTDELLQRYSISRTVGPGGSTGSVAGEPVSADEIGAILESVLVEAFDFGWFTRPDLPEAPELALEEEGADRAQASWGAVASSPVLEPVEWPDPGAAEDQATAEWALDLDEPRAIDPQPESELVAEPEAEPEPEPELELEPEPELEPEAEPESELMVEPEPPPIEVTTPEEPWSDPLAAAAIEVAELEEIHLGAIAAKREAITFAAATRQRLAEARQALAELEAGSGSPRP